MDHCRYLFRNFSELVKDFLANAEYSSTMRTLQICILVLCLAVAIRAQDSAEPPFTLTQIGPNVWAAISNPKARVPVGVNAGFVIGEECVAVIDTFMTVDANGDLGTDVAGQLLAEIRKLTNLPVKFVINTHYHLDHVGGNRVFADAGAVLLAQRNVHEWIHTENLKLFGAAIKPAQKAFVEALPAPVVGYEEGMDLDLGSRQIQLRSFPGHTGSDSVVLIPDARVVFAGDLFWRNTLPNLIDASTNVWVETLDTLRQKFPDYTFVPGHGGVGNVQDASAFREYLATLRNLVAEARAQGRTGDALVEAVMPALTDKYSQWDFFKYLAGPNILDADAELSGRKRIPRAP